MLSLMIIGFAQVKAIEVLENGDIILTEAEFASLTDQQIADYMVSQFLISNIQIHSDKIEIVYNLVYVEPTHVNNTYRVFNHGFKIGVVKDDVAYYRRHKKQMHRSKEKLKINDKLQKEVLEKIEKRKKDLSNLKDEIEKKYKRDMQIQDWGELKKNLLKYLKILEIYQ